MEIEEYIFEGVAELSYKKPTREYANSAGLSRNLRGGSAFSNTHSDMSKSAGKIRKRYADHPKDGSQLSRIIHDLVNSSDECKVLGDCGYNYSKDRPNKYCRQYPEIKKKFERNKNKNAIFQHSVDDIILQEKEKLSVKEEKYENIDDEVDKDELHELDKISLDYK